MRTFHIHLFFLLLSMMAPIEAHAQATSTCSSYSACLTEGNNAMQYDFIGTTTPSFTGLQDTISGATISCTASTCSPASSSFIASGDTFNFTPSFFTFPSHSSVNPSNGFTVMLVYQVDYTKGGQSSPTALLTLVPPATANGGSSNYPNSSYPDWALLYTPGSIGLTLQQRYPRSGLFYPAMNQAYSQVLWDPSLTKYQGYLVVFVSVYPDARAIVDSFLFDGTQYRYFSWYRSVVLDGYPATYQPNNQVKTLAPNEYVGFGAGYNLPSYSYPASNPFSTQPGVTEVAYFLQPLTQLDILAQFEQRAVRVPGANIASGQYDFTVSSLYSALTPCNTGSFLSSSPPSDNIVIPCGTTNNPIHAFDPSQTAQ